MVPGVEGSSPFIHPRYALQTKRITTIMGCRQAVRHQTLTLAFVGSNPASPAKKRFSIVIGHRKPARLRVFALHAQNRTLWKRKNMRNRTFISMALVLCILLTQITACSRRSRTGLSGGLSTFEDRQDSSTASANPSSSALEPGGDDSGSASGGVNGSASGYQRGTITKNGFYSEYLDLSFTTPAGYTMATSEELDKMIAAVSDNNTNSGKNDLDYAMVKTVYEMKVDAVDGSLALIVLVERLAVASTTEQQYLEAAQTQLSTHNVDYSFNINPNPVTIAERDFSVLTAFTDEYRQYYYVRKIDDRMLVFFVTCAADIDSTAKAMFLLLDFQPYSTGENGAGGTSSTGTIEITIAGETYDSSVTVLELNQKGIVDLSPLAGMTQLTGLYLLGNDISDLSPLANLTQLQILFLSLNNISDLSPLANLTQLQRLYLSSNDISDISALKGLTNLETLNIDRNRIVDVSALNGMTKLSFLTMIGNNVSDISVLQGLTKLETAYLSYNQIDDISALGGLDRLKALTLSSNPLSQQQIDKLKEALPGCDIEFT